MLLKILITMTNLCYGLIIVTFFTLHDVESQVPNWQWARGIGGIDFDVSLSIAVDPVNTGRIYTTGYFRRTIEFGTGQVSNILTASEPNSTFITHHDNEGNLIWTKAFKGSGGTSGTQIAVDAHGSGDVYSRTFCIKSTLSMQIYVTVGEMVTGEYHFRIWHFTRDIRRISGSRCSIRKDHQYRR